MREFKHQDIGGADLIIDATYKGGSSKQGLKDEVISKLLPGLGNAGGIRAVGSASTTPLVVLFSNGTEPNWPDEIDEYQGTFLYYGDNRTPGKGLHETKKKGNVILQRAFQLAHGDLGQRAECPIFLIFEGTGVGLDVRFRGLAIPGGPNWREDEDLIAIWRVTNGVRFQNYRALFTVLDVGTINGDWIREVIRNKTVDYSDSRAPKVLRDWVKKGTYKPLIAEQIKQARTQDEQTPTDKLAKTLIQTIRSHCKDDDFLFEAIAVRIWEMSIHQPTKIDLTRRYRDGGRDAVGSISIGPTEDPIQLEFCLEAKHYEPGSSVGVKEISRLISRIKHREFGVLVTTSHLAKQAYEEIRSDGHPIVVISGADIARILFTKGINSVESCKTWLETIPDPRQFHGIEQSETG